MGQWQALVVLFVLSSVGFAGANIFYDAFLVDVTTDDRMDMVSTQGFAYGYIASIIPFGISLAIIYLLGMDKAIGFQIAFVITALWWGFFTIPLLRHVKQVHYVEPEPRPVYNSFRRLAQTFKDIKKQRLPFLFLLAYFFYIDGVDTIIRMVVPYAQTVFGEGSMDMFMLLGVLLLIQIVAFPCALLFGRLANRFGTLFMIRVGILVYIMTTIYAWTMNSITDVFILGGMVAFAQGGIQALSRSYFAKIIPKEKSNEYFGFYNIFGKFAAILGPFLMSLITQITKQPKLSILAVLPLFLIGLLLSFQLPKFEEEN